VLIFAPTPNPNGSLVLLLPVQLLPLLPKENEGRGARCGGSSSSGSEDNLRRGFSGVFVVLSIMLVPVPVGDGEEEKVSVGTELLEPVEDEDDDIDELQPKEVDDVRAGGEEDGTEEDVVFGGRLLRVRAGALRWREGRRDMVLCCNGRGIG